MKWPPWLSFAPRKCWMGTKTVFESTVNGQYLVKEHLTLYFWRQNCSGKGGKAGGGVNRWTVRVHIYSYCICISGGGGILIYPALLSGAPIFFLHLNCWCSNSSYSNTKSEKGISHYIYTLYSTSTIYWQILYSSLSYLGALKQSCR